MKLLQLAGILAFAASAFAQGIQIATPTSGQHLKLGKPFVVEVDKPDTLDTNESVSVVIGLQICGSSPCPIADNDGILGQILYAGDYSPQKHEVFRPFYQNFTFTPGTDSETGNAVIHVVHLHLLGAGPFATLETRNVSVTLVN